MSETSNGGFSFVLLPRSATPTADEFLRAWRELFGAATTPSVAEWGDEGGKIELEGASTIVVLAPIAVPKGEAENAARNSMSGMRDGGFTPAPHVAHLVAVSAAEDPKPFDRLHRHTKVVAALAKAGAAVGVYEGNAGATHATDFYCSVAASDPSAALMLWNGVSVAKSGDRVELLSLGMSQLELPDILVTAPATEGGEAFPFLFDLLSYVASRGRIAAGETVGRTPAEKLPVSYVPSPIDPGTQVMKVELGRPKKSWWPFGRK